MVRGLVREACARDDVARHGLTTMQEASPFPKSAVRRVPRTSPSTPAHQEPPAANDIESLGSRARELADALLEGRGPDGAGLQDLGGAVARALPLADRDRQALARVLTVPVRLALRWTQDTISLLRAAEALTQTSQGRALLATRLELIAWAWAPLPEVWEPAREDQVARGWADEARAASRPEDVG